MPRRVAVIALVAVALVAVLLVGRWLVHSRAPYTGTNSVAPKYNLAPPKPHRALCIRDITLPAGTNDLQLRLAGATRTPARLTLRLDAGGQMQVSNAFATAALGPVDFRIRPPSRDVPARACFSTVKLLAAESGQPGSAPGSGVAYLGGKPIGSPSLWYLHLPARRLVSALPDGASRASLFRAGFVGPWTYVLLGVLVLVAWIAGMRVVLRGTR